MILSCIIDIQWDQMADGRTKFRGKNVYQFSGIFGGIRLFQFTLPENTGPISWPR